MMFDGEFFERERYGLFCTSIAKFLDNSWEKINSKESAVARKGRHSKLRHQDLVATT